jgi:hypothetical protein
MGLIVVRTAVTTPVANLELDQRSRKESSLSLPRAPSLSPPRPILPPVVRRHRVQSTSYSDVRRWDFARPGVMKSRGQDSSA